MHYRDCAAKNLRIWFVSAEFAGNEDVAEIAGNAQVPENESQPAVKVRDHGELKTGSQLLERFRHFRVKLPDAWFGEMFVSDFEEIIAIEFVHRRRDLIEHVTNELTPPAFVVIFARTVDCQASRHLFPIYVKCALQL